MAADGFLLIASAVSFATAFLWPSCTWWTIFLFMPLLLFRVARAPMTNPFLEGYVWGILAFGLHMSWIFVLMIRKAFAWQFGLIGAALLVCYFALYSALWFYCAERIARSCSEAMRIIIWSLTSLAFFFFVERYIFFISGQCDGYPLMTPLLPLATCPKTLYCLPYIGTYGLFAVLTAGAIALVLFLQRRRIIFLLFMITCCIPFCIGSIVRIHEVSEPLLANIGYVKPPARSLQCYNQFAHVVQHVSSYIKSFPETSLICMPETTISGAFNEHPEWVTALESILPFDVSLCLGSHAYQNGAWHNRLYLIKNGLICDVYDKQHCMPFAEHLPFPWSMISAVQDIMLHQCQQFCPGKRVRTVINTENICFFPYICSELFCTNDRPGADRSIPIVCILNDSWFASYVRRLLHLLAAYKALSWQRTIFYVGHYDGILYTESGNSYAVCS